ncbi:MAG: hypothetical protein Q9202_004474 [Teloschistes flavicans]
MNRVLSQSEVNRTDVDQDKPHTPVGGEERLPESVPPLQSSSIKSKAPDPRSWKEDGITQRQAGPLLPPNSRASDLLWYIWTDILNDPANGAADEIPTNANKYTPTDPGRLRYIGHYFVNNEVSEAVIEHVLMRKYERT